MLPHALGSVGLNHSFGTGDQSGVGFTYLIALLVAGISLVRPRAPLADGDPPIGTSRPIRAVAAALAIAGSYLLELWVFEQRQGVATPIPVLSGSGVALILDSIFIIQSCLLVALARVIGRPSRPLVVALSSVAFVMLAFSLNQQNTGGDVVAYVGSTLEANPYAPSQQPFPARFASINGIWGLPLIPSTYGPLWNALAKIAAAPFDTLRGKILGIQILGALALLSIVVTLVRTKAPPAVVALVALNPFLWETYVAEGHNDLVAAAFVVVAARSTKVRSIALLVVAAAAIKVSFALTGLSALARIRTPRDRVLGFLSIGVLALLTIALVGPQYPRSVVRVLQLYAHPLPFGDVALRRLTELAVGCFALGAVLRGRVPWGAGWITIAVGQFPLTNYLCWGLPTALVGNGATVFLAALPYAAFEANNILVETPLSTAIRIVVAALLAVTLVVALRKGRLPIGFTERRLRTRGI
jgi:hypothetical protein